MASILYSAVCKNGYIFTHSSPFEGNDLYTFTKKALKKVEKNNRGIFQRQDE